MRSSACDTLIRFCAQHVLCWPAFPLVPALRSPGSAATFPADASAVDFFALFAGFTATMAGADFSCPCLINRKSVALGKRVDLRGRPIIKKKKKKEDLRGRIIPCNSV